jgi:tetratricopeptide (TPR) repeat protein
MSDLRRFALLAYLACALLAGAGVAAAQSLGELDHRLNALAPRVDEATANPAAASDVVSELDQAESDFAKIAENSRVDRDAMLSAYTRLDRMLDRIYTAYQKRKDACIAEIDNGGTCDYEQPEQIALRALYPLSWLRFEGATLYADEPSMARRLLNEAIDGFTTSTLILVSPELVRENLLGRAFSERELGKFDRSEYAKAITDFREIMKDGAETGQYRAAQQGLATTYAAMGKLGQAQGMTSELAANATGAQRQGLEMLRLRELFQAEATASDPAKRAQLHREAVEFIRSREGDKGSWAVAVAAAADYVPDPIAEFGASNDPFENYLLANVLYFKHRPLDAAKYYWAAARSGKYPKAYKYAADLYYSAGRLDLVESLVSELARHPSNPDAQWASYMRFKIPRIRWERSGMRNAQFESQWIAGAQDYLKEHPRGQYAYEARFRLGEIFQKRGNYLDAAREYEQVAGNPDYDFTARFNAAECYYELLAGKGRTSAAPAANEKSQPSNVDREAIRNSTIGALREAIKLEPAAERSAPLGQHKALHDSRGRAVYMLATLLEHEPKVDDAEVASILDGFETQYPTMSAHFNETFEWRVEALDHLGNYAELQLEMTAFVARDQMTPAGNDFVKEIGYDLWKNGTIKNAQGDRNGYLADARLTAVTYEYFERMVKEGKIPAKNLSGTLSILGQAYLATNQVDRAHTVFNQVVAADPGSPDANAGLARIAQTRKDYRDAMDLWSRVESVAAESDTLFYEAKYNLAEIFAAEGNINGACNKLAVTRSEHPNLGSPEMKAQWTSLQRKLCLDHTAG